MGLRGRFEEILNSDIKISDYDPSTIDFLLAAVCAEFRHDWPMEFIDTGDKIRTYVSGPCKQCGEEKP